MNGARMKILSRMLLGLLLPWIMLGLLPSAHGDGVPYIQSPTSVVEAMLAIAGVGPQDYVTDLGSGDGRKIGRASCRERV